jgi:methylated-DNA-[protein]-cysteine S-methyltransferase
MTAELRYITFNTDMGWVGILASAKGLRCVTLPQRSAQEGRQLLGKMDDATWAPHLFDDLVQRFRLYFSGHRVTFPDELDFSGAAPFHRRAWEQTRLIPYGETRSYAWVAEQVGRPGAARAVGQAMASNPWPIIIPCHRVITSDGRLGGFGGGLEMKKQLLSLEAAAGIG